MSQEDLRAIIRELLVEELAVFKVEMAQDAGPTRVCEETVAIANDADLAEFVRRLLGLAGDAAARTEIEAGRHVFRLATGATAAPAAHRNGPAKSFDKGLISEKEVMALPKGQRVISVGKAVCFTPLALDVLRQRGIAIERMKS